MWSTYRYLCTYKLEIIKMMIRNWRKKVLPHNTWKWVYGTTQSLSYVRNHLLNVSVQTFNLFIIIFIRVCFSSPLPEINILFDSTIHFKHCYGVLRQIFESTKYEAFVIGICHKFDERDLVQGREHLEHNPTDMRWGAILLNEAWILVIQCKRTSNKGKAMKMTLYWMSVDGRGGGRGAVDARYPLYAFQIGKKKSKTDHNFYWNKGAQMHKTVDKLND